MTNEELVNEFMSDEGFKVYDNLLLGWEEIHEINAKIRAIPPRPHQYSKTVLIAKMIGENNREWAIRAIVDFLKWRARKNEGICV